MSRNFLASNLEDLNKLVPNPPPINHATPIVRLFVACDTLITEVRWYSVKITDRVKSTIPIKIWRGVLSFGCVL